MIGLTGREINVATTGASYLAGATVGLTHHQKIARAQLKRIAEWGNGKCEHTPSTWGSKPNTRRHECDKCWQYLLNEVKDV